MPVGLVGKSVSGRSIFGSGRSKMAPGPGVEASRLERAGKPVESIESADLLIFPGNTENTPNARKLRFLH